MIPYTKNGAAGCRAAACRIVNGAARYCDAMFAGRVQIAGVIPSAVER